MKLVVACDPEGGIGYQNQLPWTKIQGDLPRFKQLTTNKVILMGRNTWESLRIKPLPDRINVVVTSQQIEGVTTINSLPDTDTMDLTDVWLIGGAALIESSWHLINEVYLTRTFHKYTCDKFLDIVKLSKEFRCNSVETFSDHTFEIWVKK